MLITRSEDERLSPGNAETLPSIEDTPKTVELVHDLRNSLRAALSRLALADKVVEAAEELACLTDMIIDGNYTPDSFTTQPIRAALASWKEFK